MTVFIRNMQRVVRVNKAQLNNYANMIVSCAGYQDYDVGLIMVQDKEIQLMNQQYRGKDEVTDVLAFPYHEVDIAYYGLFLI